MNLPPELIAGLTPPVRRDAFIDILAHSNLSSKFKAIIYLLLVRMSQSELNNLGEFITNLLGMEEQERYKFISAKLDASGLPTSLVELIKQYASNIPQIQ